MGKIPFCDLCGRILETTHFENEIIGKCACGFSKKILLEVSFSDKLEEKEIIGEGVLNQNDELSQGFPHVCMKCGYPECDVCDLGVQIGDESNIILYKCKKCKYVERQADGSGNN